MRAKKRRRRLTKARHLRATRRFQSTLIEGTWKGEAQRSTHPERIKAKVICVWRTRMVNKERVCVCLSVAAGESWLFICTLLNGGVGVVHDEIEKIKL